MKTRTLLLLAVACGVLILAAGGVQLLRLSDQKEAAAPVAPGVEGVAGDARVTLLGVAVAGDRLTATVRIAGVDDAAGTNGFTMISPGAPRRVVGGSCGAFTVAAQQCTLEFDTSGVDGVVRQLLLRRAGEQLRWVLVNPSGAVA